MRHYGKVLPTFWIGDTGKAIRKKGVDAQLVALYLLTSPHSTMLGLYYLPICTLAHETGLSQEGASKALASLSEALFSSYDAASEVVWVHEMAKFQIADRLTAADNRVKGIQRDYLALPNNPFLKAFFDKYASAFHLKILRDGSRPLQAPSKPLRSQEQEQEQKQTTSAAKKPRPAKGKDYSPEFLQALSSYPARDGGNPKPRAWKAWSARLREGSTAQQMLEGVRRYALHIRAKAKEGTEFVLQAATFFGPDKNFLESWEQPKHQSQHAPDGPCGICQGPASIIGKFGPRCQDHLNQATPAAMAA